MAARWRTALAELLTVEYPIIQAPMAGWTTPRLVAAVSEAGGLGMLPTSRLTLEQVRGAVHDIRRLTDRPFGANLLVPDRDEGGDEGPLRAFAERLRTELGLPSPVLPPPPPSPGEVVQLLIDERVPIVTFGMGSPEPHVPALRARGIRVGAMVTTVAEALEVAGCGVDFIVAQGAEAGGHRSTFAAGRTGDVPLVGTLALVPQVVDAVRVPVAAAGGIMDGRGIAAALMLGAAGVQLGTRFLLARESAAPADYRRRLLAADETSTVITRAYTGRPARSIRNRWVERFESEGLEPLGWPRQGALFGDIYQAAIQRGDADHFPVLAGQGVRLARDERPAGELVAELVAAAEAVLQGVAGVVA